MARLLSRRGFIRILSATTGTAPFLSLSSLAIAQPVQKDVARKHIPGVKMALTQEEIDTLNGKQGSVMAKVMQSLVKYGDTFDAPYLVDLTTPGHWVTGMGQKGLDALYDLADVLIEGGVKAKIPFTIDPYPMDYENIDYTKEEIEENKDLYCFQERWDKQVQALGVRDKGRKSYSCTCYLPEVGNRPAYGTMLGWAESSAVVFANSVLGARCNRNSGPIEMLSSIAGKTPYFGLLTDEERKATWLVEIKTSKLPSASLLGSAVGMAVGSEVPYIVGLDKFLGTKLADTVIDYLKDFGAATASNGAVALFHVDNLTPEAVEFGKNKLMASKVQKLVVTDELLQKTQKDYPILWKDPQATPRYAIAGCPHCTLSQLVEWDHKVDVALRASGRSKLAIPLIVCASPLVIEHLTPTQKARMKANGIRISTICGAMYMINQVSRSFPCITNSNKLRTYSTARFYTDDDFLKYAVTGKAPKQVSI